MLRIPKYILLLFIVGFARGQEIAEYHPFPDRFSQRLRVIAARLRDIDGELRTLPVTSDVDAGGTHGFHSNFSPTSEEHWFEIGWDEPQVIDGIAVIPTRITTQSGLTSNYGFPVSLRIEATRRGEKNRFILAEVSDTRLDLRRGEPLFLDVRGKEITSLRFIPVNLPTLPGKDVRCFSLAEAMVYQGAVNIARSGKLSAPFSVNGEMGWNINYLTDEQSSLGPPELPQPGNSLGWHADLGRGAATPTWAIIDLGSLQDFETIRLVAAIGDAPLKGPGFGFPVSFHFETAEKAMEGPWKTLWSSGDRQVTNPGYNPMKFHFPPARGRYVRVSIDKLHAPDAYATPRLILSEMEVLHGLDNLALNRPVSTPDSYASIFYDAKRIWSRAGLTDGYSSTGRLIGERRWVWSLSRRFNLICEKDLLGKEQTNLLKYWDSLTISSIFAALSATVIVLLAWQVRQRLVNQNKILALRNRISSDLHDEVGSNLATISLLSELTPDPTNLEDIHRLSQETSLALREIVEINLSSIRARKPLAERLRDIASLMLRKHEWTFEASASPSFDLEQRKHLIFYFKESLHNIIRHARAKTVHITLDKVPPHYRLYIEDDGQGIQNAPPDMIGNLHTLRQRAANLGGTFTVESQPGKGTRLTLLFPIHPLI